MKKMVKFSLALLVILFWSCEKEVEVTKSSIFVEPDLQFTFNDSLYHFPYQVFGSEKSFYLDNEIMPGSVILDYQMNFNGKIKICLRKKFLISELENPSNYFDNFSLWGHYGQMSNSTYQLSENEFHKILKIGDYEINATGYIGIDEGVIIYLQKDFDDSVYISTHSANVPNQYFRIDEFKKISKSDLSNTDHTDMDISPDIFTAYENIYLGKASFNITLVNSEKSDTIKMKQGTMTFVAYN